MNGSGSWSAPPAKAETALAELVATYRNSAPKLAAWLEESVPEALAVFALPEHHRRRMRTSNPMERAVQQELKRRTVKVRVFPGEDALERLVSAILVEIDEKWASDTKAPSPPARGRGRGRRRATCRLGSPATALRSVVASEAHNCPLRCRLHARKESFEPLRPHLARRSRISVDCQSAVALCRECRGVVKPCTVREAVGPH